jgi:hypothetical protein
VEVQMMIEVPLVEMAGVEVPVVEMRHIEVPEVEVCMVPVVIVGTVGVNCVDVRRRHVQVRLVEVALVRVLTVDVAFIEMPFVQMSDIEEPLVEMGTLIEVATIDVALIEVRSLVEMTVIEISRIWPAIEVSLVEVAGVWGQTRRRLGRGAPSRHCDVLLVNPRPGVGMPGCRAAPYLSRLQRSGVAAGPLRIVRLAHRGSQTSPMLIPVKPGAYVQRSSAHAGLVLRRDLELLQFAFRRDERRRDDGFLGTANLVGDKRHAAAQRS